jgi:hypothetical protein
MRRLPCTPQKRKQKRLRFRITRSRANCFINKLAKLGLIRRHGELHVHSSRRSAARLELAPTFALIGKRHTSRSLLVAELAIAYPGLLAGREFIDVHYHERIFSVPSPQLRKASGLRVVLNAEHLNAAHNAPQEWRRTSDKRRRTPVLASGPSSSC